MNPLIQLKRVTPVFLVGLGLTCFGLSHSLQAVVPAPDGGYAGSNTAEGANALFTLTTGAWNTAIGGYALFSDTTGGANTALGTLALYYNTTGSYNTATGVNALEFNTSGVYNTANGAHALFHNTAGIGNTATGFDALAFNITGSYNTANGFQALSHTTGSYNTANGFQALSHNTTGLQNTADGAGALSSNNTGEFNTAVGVSALQSNTTGSYNTANGWGALVSNAIGNSNTAYGANALALNVAGNNNIALGNSAGLNFGGPPFDSDNNICIGNVGVTGESNTIRIGGDTGYGPQTATFIAGISGTAVLGNTVVVDGNGQLGTFPSATRFKKEIKPMDTASEVILGLRPVTFHYKNDKTDTPQFGLIAEEVANVNPDLVVRDKDGEIYTVRYEAVNAMLLNEFLKEHRKNEEQEKTIAELKSGMTALAATVKEQAAQIQKVSAQLEASKPAPQVVNNP